MLLETSDYLPDLTSCGFFLFLAVKNYVWGTYFETVEEIQKVTMSVLNNLQGIFLWKCFDRNNADFMYSCQMETTLKGTTAVQKNLTQCWSRFSLFNCQTSSKEAI
jgi:hypothetical protein